jgi:hypothetical protein
VLAGTRAQVTVRSRYTEQRLAELTDRGLDQYVLLGAGLDSFAYRSPLAPACGSSRSTTRPASAGSASCWPPPTSPRPTG